MLGPAKRRDLNRSVAVSLECLVPPHLLLNQPMHFLAAPLADGVAQTGVYGHGSLEVGQGEVHPAVARTFAIKRMIVAMRLLCRTGPLDHWNMSLILPGAKSQEARAC